MGSTSARSTGRCSTSRGTAGSSRWCATSTTATGPSPRSGRATTTRRRSAGSAGTDADHNVFAFVRHDPRTDPGAGRPVVCVANLSPVPRHEYGIDVPVAGEWEELLDTDSRFYGGSDVGNGGLVTAAPTDGGGHLRLALPPLGVLWLAPRDGSP